MVATRSYEADFTGRASSFALRALISAPRNANGLSRSDSSSLTGACARRIPCGVLRKDSVRVTVIWPRQGKVGTLPAYSQLFIQPSAAGFGALLKVNSQ